MNRELSRRIINILWGIYIASLCIFVGAKIHKYGFFTSEVSDGQVIWALLNLIIIIIFSLSRIKKDNSTIELGKYLEQWKDEPWFKEKNKNAEKLAGNYYFKESLSTILAQAVLSIAMIIFIQEIYYYVDFFSLLTTRIIPLCMLIFIFLGVLSYNNQMMMYRVLYDDCDPFTCILAFYKRMSFARGKQFRVTKTFKLIAANMLFYTGDFNFTLKYIEMIEKEHNYRSNFMFKIGYIKFLCFVNNGDYDGAKKYKDIIEKKVTHNSRLKRSKKIKKTMLKFENNLDYINGNYERVREFDENMLKESKFEFQRVGIQYGLFQIDKALGNDESAQQRKDYILEHGNELFYAKKVV